MRRMSSLALVLLALAGCQITSEKVQVKPLADEADLPKDYDGLRGRLQKQAAMATEVFYRDEWCELEDVAKGIEQTAKKLPDAEKVPEKLKAKVQPVSRDLLKDAASLQKAAKARDEKEITKILANVNRNVRELR